MGLRKACAYSKKYARPYTRKSKVKEKNFIKTVPPQKIVKFEMGNLKAYGEGKYPYVLKAVTKENIQLRDNALEASRQSILKDLDLLIPGAYYFAVKKYPHHIYRENRVYSGGSKGERVNTGMQMSFGTAMGRIAILKAGESIFVIAVGEKRSVAVSREAIRKVKAKLACGVKLVYEENLAKKK